MDLIYRIFSIKGGLKREFIREEGGLLEKGGGIFKMGSWLFDGR